MIVDKRFPRGFRGFRAWNFCQQRVLSEIFLLLLLFSTKVLTKHEENRFRVGYGDTLILGEELVFKLEIKFSWIFSSFVNLFKDTLFLRWLIFNKELIFFSL